MTTDVKHFLKIFIFVSFGAERKKKKIVLKTSERAEGSGNTQKIMKIIFIIFTQKIMR